MPRLAYVNGRYVPHRMAAVHVEDRGYQLADGVYEVCEVRAGRLIDERRHLARLDRSLGELRIRWPMAKNAIGIVLREVVRRNLVDEGIVYLQITRGVAARDHAFPSPAVRPSIVVTARSMRMATREERAQKGVAVVTTPDNRWGRVDIKSIALLPNVLARQKGREAGAFETWFVDRDGLVTEGASTNAWIVTVGGKVLTRQLGENILAGVTRAGLLDLIAAEGLSFEERAFSVADAQKSREAFISSASTAVTPVVEIDGQKVGSGRPGKLAIRLRRAFLAAGEPSTSGGKLV
jgi:D-alanine transaminase